MSHDSYVYAAMAALILFALYRRFRRLFGRQPLQTTRIRFRIGILALLTAMLALRGLRGTEIALAGIGGFAFGAAFAWLVGLRLTRFESTPRGVFYTPNGYVGIALSALLLGRLVYRFVVLYPSLQAAHADGGDPFGAFQKSPLTAALFGVVIGYYLAYYIGLLLRSAALPAPVENAQSVDSASPPAGP